MIDWLVYLATGGFAGIVLSFGIALFKVGPGKPEFNFGRCFIVCMLITLGGPFAYVEYQTRTYGKQISPVVKNYFNSSDCPLVDKIGAIKVLHTTKNTAHVLLIGKELESWGGYDRPVMKLKLTKSNPDNPKSVWSVSKGEVLRSARLNKDNFVWPPYQ
jgi:hypothetical protein